jgi:hypothetical protein
MTSAVRNPLFTVQSIIEFHGSGFGLFVCRRREEAFLGFGNGTVEFSATEDA